MGELIENIIGVRRCFLKGMVAMLAFMTLCSATRGQLNREIGNDGCCSKFFLEQRYSVDWGDLLHVGNSSRTNDFFQEFGVSFSYIPSRLGYYGGLSLLYQEKYECENTDDYGSSHVLPALGGGVAYRPFPHVGIVDFQLYGGLTLCKMPGFDVGMRVAAGARPGRSAFSWWSLSLGVSSRWNVPFVTVGLSVAAVGVGISTVLDFLNFASSIAY